MKRASTNQLLALLDREQKLLADDNWHAASVVLGLAADRLREMQVQLREGGLDPEEAG